MPPAHALPLSVETPFVYATRSVVPSRYANAVQSAHMACAFSRVFFQAHTVYRSRRRYAQNPRAAFAHYGLPLPDRSQAIVSHESLDWSYYYLRAFRRYFEALPRRSLVYTRNGTLATLADAAGHPVVIEFHDPVIPTYTWLLRRLRRLGRLPKVVATTPRLRDDLVRLIGFASDEVHIAGGGADPEAFSGDPIPPVDRSRPFNVGYAGSALKGKGLEIVVACAARLPDVGFHVIGPDLADCLRHGPVAPNLVIYGRKDHTEVVRRLKAMDALLLPNQRSVIIRSGADIGSHTSPLKMFEYMAAGRPVVASDLPVITGTLQHEQNALLCPPEDSAAFCAALLRLRASPDLALRLGDRARADFLARHTWDARARGIRDFLFA